MIDIDVAFDAAVAAYAAECGAGAPAVHKHRRVAGYGYALVACPARPSGAAQAFFGFDEREWRILAAGGMVDAVAAGVPAQVADDLVRVVVIDVDQAFVEAAAGTAVYLQPDAPELLAVDRVGDYGHLVAVHDGALVECYLRFDGRRWRRIGPIAGRVDPDELEVPADVMADLLRGR